MQTNKLYVLLGISEMRFEKIIKPFMDDLMSRRGNKADTILIAIEQNHNLFPEEIAYCSYCVGRMAATADINNKTGGLARRFGLID
jgi:hypothetical protein